MNNYEATQDRQGVWCIYSKKTNTYHYVVKGKNRNIKKAEVLNENDRSNN